MGGSVSVLLKRLSAMQGRGEGCYPIGIFPSQRVHEATRTVREDDNVFFTACIVDMLQRSHHLMTDDEIAVADDICARAVAAYPLYRNKNGLDTYNYWRTRPSRHFPNGRFMHRFDHFSLPDDIDDTALVYLTEKASDERVLWLREKLKVHANLAYRQARNTFPEYRHLKVYSSFIGKNMYIDFDVCVLSNLMRLLLPVVGNDLNEYDRDSLYFIADVVRKGRHLTDPYLSAPQYASSHLILFHLSRLVPLLPKDMMDLRDIVNRDLHVAHRTSVGMSRLMLENALLELGETPKGKTSWLDSVINDPRFNYFIAGLLTAYEGTLPQMMARWPITQLKYRSEAFNVMLLIHNRLLNKQG
jgi:hypothetical protein